jgi:hypothetical protein
MPGNLKEDPVMLFSISRLNRHDGLASPERGSAYSTQRRTAVYGIGANSIALSYENGMGTLDKPRTPEWRMTDDAGR